MQSDVLAFQQVSEFSPAQFLQLLAELEIKQMDLATLRLDGVSAATRAFDLVRLYNTKPKRQRLLVAVRRVQGGESDRGQQMVLALSEFNFKAQIRRVHDWREERHSTAAFLLHGAQEVRKGLWFLLRRLEKELGRDETSRRLDHCCGAYEPATWDSAVGSLSSEHGVGVEIAAQPKAARSDWLARRLAADSKFESFLVVIDSVERLSGEDQHALLRFWQILCSQRAGHSSAAPFFLCLLCYDHRVLDGVLGGQGCYAPPFPVERPVLLDPVVPFNRVDLEDFYHDNKSRRPELVPSDARKSALVDAVLEATSGVPERVVEELCRRLTSTEQVCSTTASNKVYYDVAKRWLSLRG